MLRPPDDTPRANATASAPPTRDHTNHSRAQAHANPAWVALTVISGFNALSALAGGIAILAGWLQMPQSMLDSGPFDSFVWPGIILLIVVGGTQTTSLCVLLWRSRTSLVWSALAGFGMIIWIFVETGVIAGLSWLQVLYFGTGTSQLILVLILLGIVSSRRPFTRSAQGTAAQHN